MGERNLTQDRSTNLAKIRQPQADGVLLREALFSKLDTFSNKPITWVIGPGGAGKTTLVTSYLEERKLPCLWYQIDTGDGDLATFFYYLGLAGQMAAPRRRKPLPFFTPEYSYGILEFSRSFFEELFNRLKTPCVVVFDNYQDAAEGSPMHNAILEGVSRMPEGINLILISRATAPTNFSRLKANSMMDTVDWHDLRLTEQEFEIILDMRCSKKAPRDIMLDICRRLDGWAAEDCTCSLKQPVRIILMHFAILLKGLLKRCLIISRARYLSEKMKRSGISYCRQLCCLLRPRKWLIH